MSVFRDMHVPAKRVIDWGGKRIKRCELGMFSEDFPWGEGPQGGSLQKEMVRELKESEKCGGDFWRCVSGPRAGVNYENLMFE